MGTTIMAKVKARSFTITSLRCGQRRGSVHVFVRVHELLYIAWLEAMLRGHGGTHVGTAGVMFDFSLAAGLAPTVSSLSRMVFSLEMIRRVAIGAV